MVILNPFVHKKSKVLWRKLAKLIDVFIDEYFEILKSNKLEVVDPGGTFLRILCNNFRARDLRWSWCNIYWDPTEWKYVSFYGALLAEITVSLVRHEYLHAKCSKPNTPALLVNLKSFFLALLGAVKVNLARHVHFHAEFTAIKECATPDITCKMF